MLWVPPVDCQSGTGHRPMNALDLTESPFRRQAFNMSFFSIPSTSMNDGKVGEMVVALVIRDGWRQSNWFPESLVSVGCLACTQLFSSLLKTAGITPVPLRHRAVFVALWDALDADSKRRFRGFNIVKKRALFAMVTELRMQSSCMKITFRNPRCHVKCFVVE